MNPTSQGKLNDSSKKLLKHRFEDESGTEYTGNEFGDFGSYMNHKRIKIQNQAQEILRQQQESKPSESESSSNKDVFKGCIIYINGYTGIKHSTEELQRMIISHGGIYVQHMTGKTSVTHIVATTLTSRKKSNLLIILLLSQNGSNNVLRLENCWIGKDFEQFTSPCHEVKQNWH